MRRVSPDKFPQMAERPLLEALVPCPLGPTPSFETCSNLFRNRTIANNTEVGAAAVLTLSASTTRAQAQDDPCGPEVSVPRCMGTTAGEPPGMGFSGLCDPRIYSLALLLPLALALESYFIFLA